ncbi:MAG: hypothetical protein ACOY45_14150 [Pseudomonadota bacterium]
MYIPSNIGQISDRIGAMVLCMPDMELPNTDLGMDGAFAQLEHSLGLVRAKLGDDKYHRLIEMARESKRVFIDGDDLGGRVILADMKKLLRTRG